MGKIAVLSQQMVNKIAAGEVVERPASVLKELMENSLDAHATQIRVELEDGGRKLIQVSDNGIGMTADDLQLAFIPHATSKLSSEEDLYNIGTLGFRGEALASIASVSQVKAVTRARGAIEAAQLIINGGRAEPVKPAAAPEGTTISVRNLFYNTPARRKFLRTANTEMSHLTEQFVRLGLVNSNVGFVLIHNGRKIHDLPAHSSVTERIARFFSPELADGLMPIKRIERNHSHSTIEITGYIARPQHSRANTQWQYVFLNGRHIRDKFISHAIREAYRGMLEINRQPIVFLFINMPPDQVDVNVHPAKTEVRFSNSNMVHSQVLAAIRDKLLSTDLTVTMRTDRLGTTTNTPVTSNTTAKAIANDNMTGSTNSTNIANETNPETLQEHRQRVRQAMADFFNHSAPQKRHTINNQNKTSFPTEHFPAPVSGSSATISRHIPAYSTPPQYDRLQDYRNQSGSYAAPNTKPSPETTPQSQSLRFMQIHNAYIVIETPEGMVIIDQHALHERILYEKMLANLQTGPLPSQRCLIPEVIDVTPAQMAVLQRDSETLRQFGIQLEQFGPSSVAIQAFPVLLDKAKPTEVISDLLDSLAEQSGKVSKEELIHHLLDTIACKAAVKAGDKLNDMEIASLLAQRKHIDRSGNCPHGRPTTIRMTLAELNKQFKRT